MTTRLPALPLAALASILLLAGCAAPSTPADQSTDNPVVTDTAAPDAGAGGDICDALEAAGATGASIGPFSISAPKEEMAAAVDEQLAILSAVEPPEEFFDQWNTQLQYVIEYKFAVDQLPEGGSFGADAMPPADPGAHAFWSDFWFDTCG